jgi:type IV secretion system protein VirB9
MRPSWFHLYGLMGVLSIAAPAPTASALAAAPDGAARARTITYHEHDVVGIQTRLRFTTVIVLPKTEQILDVVCGDKEFWPVSGALNIAYVKPAKARATTDLHLVTAAGHIYSFILTEGADGEPDVKVFVEADEDVLRTAMNRPSQWASAEQVDDWRQQIELAKAETREVKANAEREVSQIRRDVPGSLKFPYRFEPNKPPFVVSAIYHDDRCTYIRATPRETPALYELVDGVPTLVNFEFRDGVFTVGKVLDRGYLALGKQRLTFTRQEE